MNLQDQFFYGDDTSNKSATSYTGKVIQGCFYIISYSPHKLTASNKSISSISA